MLPGTGVGLQPPETGPTGTQPGIPQPGDTQTQIKGYGKSVTEHGHVSGPGYGWYV